jgi:peptide-methionine (R)-S-oxide reductase
MSPDRRTFLMTAAVAALLPGAAAAADPYAQSPWRKLSDAEWKKRLSPEAFDVLRREGTERPGSSPLLNEHRKGAFVCAGCGLPLFRSDWKYDSGTGWPSFFRAITGALGTRTDHLLIVPRTEYHCARCLGHQGHVFDDGPRPTGLRYCNDGVALRFAPA